MLLQRPSRAILLGLVLISACSSQSRATKLLDQAQSLARQAKYDDAIALLQQIETRFGDSPQAREAHRLEVLYRGLDEADRKEDRRRAKDDLTAIGRALFNYNDRYKRYPASLDALSKTEALSLLDPWGNPYAYRPSADGHRYRLECYGRDGRPGGAADDMDLLVVNGEFVIDLPWEDR